MTRLSRIALVIAVAGVLTGLGAQPAAADIIDDGHPGYLTIETAQRSLPTELSPGDWGYLAMDVALDAPSDGALSGRVYAEGPLVETHPAVQVELRECTVEWIIAAAGPECAGSEQDWIPLMPFTERSSADALDYGTLANHSTRHFLVGFTLDENAPHELMGLSAEYWVEFSAFGDTEEIGGPPVRPDTPLVLTGVAAAAPLLLALILGAAGAVLAVLARRRREVDA